jgi:hypothetical protein
MDIACRGMRERIDSNSEHDTCNGNDDDDYQINPKFRFRISHSVFRGTFE